MLKKNTLRITGGSYLSRRLCFIPENELRPTTDRIRETVFSWLQSEIREYKILDLFAGSGVLGFEALSRNASQVVFVERNKNSITQLKNNLKNLKISEKQAQVFHTDSFDYLKRSQDSFDLIFLDPPFSGNLICDFFNQINNFSCLNHLKWIYLEQTVKKNWPVLPEPWYWYRQKVAGQVKFSLLCKRTDV
ncbi:MAG: 16S rRNA (guanine(966)-N(2))-methyltransferase RsmD [Pseudomonadota bacterium]